MKRRKKSSGLTRHFVSLFIVFTTEDNLTHFTTLQSVAINHNSLDTLLLVELFFAAIISKLRYGFQYLKKIVDYFYII